MGVPLLGVLLTAFVIFKGTHGWCELCPTESTGEDNITTCNCKNSFYVTSTGKCVGFLNCPIFTPLFELGIFETVAVEVKDLITSVKYNALEVMTDKALNLLFPNTTGLLERIAKGILDSSRDVDIMKNVLKKRLVKLSGPISEELSYFFNPYMLKNKKFQLECNNNTMCVVQKVLQMNIRSLEKTLTKLLPQLVDQMIFTLIDIQKYAQSNCKENCPVIDVVVKSKDFLIGTLEGMKESSGSAIHLIVNALITAKPMNNQVFDKILSKFLYLIER